MRVSVTLFKWVVVVALAWTTGKACAAPWPRFRGPNGTGVDSETRLPTKWSDAVIKWKSPLAGVGASCPTAWKDTVFLTYSSKDGLHRFLVAFESETGKPRWTREFSLATHKKHQKNSYATETPTTDGERVVAVFTSPDAYEVRCFDVQGNELWRRDLGPFASQHGSGASPILWKDLVICCNEQDGPSFIVALDAKTGKDRWRTDRRTEIVAYSTPFVLETGHRPSLITASKLGLTALDPVTGKPEWTCAVFDSRVVASPILANGLVVGQCGSGNKGHRLVGVRPDGAGDVLKTHVAWQETKTIGYCPTPVALGEHLFIVTDMGIARCLVANTGSALWTQRLEGNFSASPIIVGDQVLALGERGDIFAFAAASTFRLASRYKLDDYFVSTPAASDGKVYLRGEAHLWCVADEKSDAPPGR